MRKLPETVQPGLRRAIELAGGTRIALARKAGVRHQAVSRWVKNGRISDKSLRKVAKSLGVSVALICDFLD